ncbi:hypothetical protein CYMTET_40923 [Cymbomonas tetramitiformis]|uniref:Serine aminopeptidase S33 domain-containing protein n=1 Tax=Cymbomonas tetramitiformis TaxID=36881 RepID=A0AAE0C736_9CHLO|nr:hypothetical protein CYMTET_40923 [Cymbomonas tetramitiformis]|eukprot:gene222-398_t
MSFDRFLEPLAFAQTQDLSNHPMRSVLERMHGRGLYTFFLHTEDESDAFLCVVSFPDMNAPFGSRGHHLERGSAQAINLLRSGRARYDRLGLYQHGNAETVHDAAAALQMFVKLNVAYVAHEWYGYGTTADRAPTFQAQSRRCAALLRLLRAAAEDLLPPVLIGYSLGCSILLAAWPRVHAEWESVVVLLAPFYDATGVVVRVPMLREICGYFALPHMHNGRLVINLRAPLMVAHGTSDQLIPVSHARDLVKAYDDVNNGQREGVLRCYAGATHTSLLDSSKTRSDLIADVRAFIHKLS